MATWSQKEFVENCYLEPELVNLQINMFLPLKMWYEMETNQAYIFIFSSIYIYRIDGRLFICFSVYLSIHLSIHPAIHLRTHVPACLFYLKITSSRRAFSFL